EARARAFGGRETNTTMSNQTWSNANPHVASGSGSGPSSGPSGLGQPEPFPQPRRVPEADMEIPEVPLVYSEPRAPVPSALLNQYEPPYMYQPPEQVHEPEPSYQPELEPVLQPEEAPLPGLPQQFNSPQLPNQPPLPSAASGDTQHLRASIQDIWAGIQVVYNLDERLQANNDALAHELEQRNERLRLAFRMLLRELYKIAFSSLAADVIGRYFLVPYHLRLGEFFRLLMQWAEWYWRLRDEVSRMREEIWRKWGYQV
ncbi:hypothetical protein QBC32DRAFT_222720, partial [Pseudoneurospora amorphoporcata]